MTKNQKIQFISFMQMQIISILLGVLGFIGALAVKELMSIAKSVNDIKISFLVLNNKHENLTERVEKLEDENN